MAIDAEREEILSLTDAAKYVQRRFGGKVPHINTMIRWCLQGLRGRRLESLKRGAQRVTSRQAVIRFFERGDDQPPVLAVTGPRGRGPVGRIDTEAARRAEQELIAEGV